MQKKKNPKGNQPWIFTGRTDPEAEAPKGHLMWSANSLEKTLMLGKIEGRRRGWQRMRWLDDVTNAMNLSLSKVQEMMKYTGSLSCCSPWGHRFWHDWAITTYQALVSIEEGKTFFLFTIVSSTVLHKKLLLTICWMRRNELFLYMPRITLGTVPVTWFKC